jgi:hypothetical protein
MEKTETMMDPATLFGKVIEYLLAGALGWLVASFSLEIKAALLCD